MKHFKYLLICLLSICIFAGCEKEEKAEIKVDRTSITLGNNAEAEEFSITSNVEWAIANTNFLTVTPTKGVAGTTYVKVYASSNTTQSERSATLSISGKGAEQSVTVKQPPVAFSLSTNTLQMERTASSKSFKISSNINWSISLSGKPEWITEVTPTSGTGNADVTVTVKENTNREKKNSHIFKINYGSTFASLVVEQDVALNNAPTKPSGLKPENGSTNVSLVPEFSWNASTDADGDPINYTVHISADGNTWEKFSAGKATSAALPSTVSSLNASTKYYYKVVADDNFNNGKTESDVVSFTTGVKDAYEDGEYVVYQQSKKSKPITLIFTGDGYVKEDHKIGGAFDKDLNTAIEGFFDIEPYKSYREYFTVYKIAAYSNQRGTTNTTTNVTKDTKFKMTMEGGNSTGISSPNNGSAVFEWCKKIPGVNDYTLNNMSIGVIINEDVYAGTCLSFSTGKHIAMITYKRNVSNPNHQTAFANVVRHAMAGHGFGRLADEYVNYQSAITEEEKESLLLWQGFGNNLNVSAYSSISDSPWAHFKGLSDYSHVSMFEGGYYFASGVWRPEQNSCMIDNRPYFNSPSRFYIVKRILEIAGELEPISSNDSDEVKAAKMKAAMDKFVAKDVKKKENAAMSAAAPGGWGGVPYDFKPLAPPILIIE